eukprot:1622406-Rhodomonas_salina.2
MWHLGVNVKSDREKGYVHLSLEEYINDMLSLFRMTDVKPALTLMPVEVGVRLTSDDQPKPQDVDPKDSAAVSTDRGVAHVHAGLMSSGDWFRSTTVLEVHGKPRTNTHQGSKTNSSLPQGSEASLHYSQAE